jgi:uncharacterized protein (DUF4415 family)/uncharacterized DUF497 family protein
MRVHFDPEKNERNIRERGLSFEFAKDFRFDSALVLVDDRREYGETRYVALGYLAERLHVLCFALLKRSTESASSASGKQTLVRLLAMPRSKPLVDAGGEVREINATDLQSFRPAAEALPASLRLKVGVRGAQKSPVKERITIRLSPDVVQRFRATGDGWQTRVDAALQDWLKTHKPAKVGR